MHQVIAWVVAVVMCCMFRCCTLSTFRHVSRTFSLYSTIHRSDVSTDHRGVSHQGSVGIPLPDDGGRRNGGPGGKPQEFRVCSNQHAVRS